MPPRRLVGRLALALLVAGWAACSTPTAPVPIQGAPLAIASFTMSETRAEVEEDVYLTANVVSGATPVGPVSYTWAANIGTVTGAGKNATWRLGRFAARTPADVTITLTVSEQYLDKDTSGAVVTRTAWVMQVAPLLRAHDSVSELTKMSVSFLVGRFGNSKISPDACLVDFSGLCQGKQDELSDITNNRATHMIYSAQAVVKTIDFDSTRTYANILAPCVFNDVYLPTGEKETAQGNCLLTGIYDQRRWWLCDSHFSVPASGSTPAKTVTMEQFFRRGGTIR